jgi:hypothetical protein
LIEEQAAIILQLQERIARLEKNSTTSSNPPVPKGKKKKRKHGGQKGHAKHNRQPFLADEIDETIIHKLPNTEVERRGLIELPQTEMALQQVSLPDKLYRVTEHLVQLYLDKNGNEVKAILPPEVRKCGLFAPDMMAAAAYFKGMCHGSYSTVQSIFAEIFNLKVCTGFLTGVCVDKVSKSLADGFTKLQIISKMHLSSAAMKRDIAILRSNRRGRGAGRLRLLPCFSILIRVVRMF